MNTTKDVRARSRRRKGILAGVAGAALLLSGSTFALWQAQDDVAGADITAGDLNLEKAKAAADWYDVSEDRTHSGTVTGLSSVSGDAIADITTYRIVPGDTLAAAFEFDMTLEGDNLVAALTAAPGSAINLTAWTELAVQAEVFVDGVSAGTVDLTDTTEQSIGYFTPQGSNQDGQAGVTALSGTSDSVIVLVTAKFDEDTADRDRVQAVAALNNLLVSLKQDRNAAAGDFDGSLAR
jgi:alternate signal-mediated exported protein